MRFKANGNGCPAYNSEKVRYFYDIDSEDAIKFIGKHNAGWISLDGYQTVDIRNQTLNNIAQSSLFIEVEEKHFEYLKKPTLEGEWEFRRYKKYDRYIYVTDNTIVSMAIYDSSKNDLLSGYRWCKVESAFNKWWNEEGSAMRPLEYEDAEEHIHYIAMIAWENGHYVAKREAK